MIQGVELQIFSHPRWLCLVRVLVSEYCRELNMEPGLVRDVILAVDETISNIMRHAYEGDTEQLIRVQCSCKKSMFQVEICDHGKVFDPFEQQMPPPDELRSGGRGIYLIRSLMDDYKYGQLAGWNCTCLSKTLSVSAEARQG